MGISLKVGKQVLRNNSTFETGKFYTRVKKLDNFISFAFSWITFSYEFLSKFFSPVFEISTKILRFLFNNICWVF
jgi:hypothetical protein